MELGMREEEEDMVVSETEEVMRDWNNAFADAVKRIEDIENCASASSLPRLNAIAHDCLSLMRSSQLRLDLLVPQQPSQPQTDSCLTTLASWKTQHDQLHARLRNANLKAKDNIRKAAEDERKLLLGGGEESTIRRRNLQTKTDMSAAAESITESLRRTRQMMVQEIERGAATLTTLDQSSGTLKKAESEYKGHGLLLRGSKQLLKIMQRQDVYDRLILFLGFLIFCSVALYIVSKRIGILTLQHKITASWTKGYSGMNSESPAVFTQWIKDDSGPYVQHSRVDEYKDRITSEMTRVDIRDYESKDGVESFFESSLIEKTDTKTINADTSPDLSKKEEAEQRALSPPT